MDTIISNSPEETELHGFNHAAGLKPGTVIGLSGELGAGKTCWVRGLARGLKVRSRVHSPTFALLNEYEGGTIPLVHIDLYRLEGVEQILDVGLEAYLLEPRGITVVEWIERWPDFKPVSPARYEQIEISTEGETQRKIRCHFLD